MPSPPTSSPTRRSLLRAAGLLVVAASTSGCGVDLRQVRWGEPEPEPPPEPGPDELARTRALTSAEDLLAAVAAARVTRPDLAALLDAQEAAHRAHLGALGPRRPPPTDPADATSPATATPSPATPSPATPSPATPSPGTDPAGDLLALEVEAAQEAATDALEAEPGLARLLASVGAARLVHATLLAPALGRPTPAPPTGEEAADGAEPASPPVRPGAQERAVAAALDAEHAAVHTFGVVAARLADGERERALASLQAHRLLAERLSTWLTDAGLPVPPAAPAYEVPALATREDVLALATRIQEQVAVLDASLVAASTGRLREAATDLLARRAVAAAAWRGTGTPFPGLPELG